MSRKTKHSFLAMMVFGIAAWNTLLATQTVLVPPTITTQPITQTLEIGDTATFSVGATGTAPLRYQWRWNREDLPGKTNRTLLLTNVQFTNVGGYSVVVTNVAGLTKSQVTALSVMPPVFTRITNGSLATNVGYGIGCAWGDYDNDDFIDLVVTMFSDSVPRKNVLFHNDRNGTFTKVTNTVVTAEGRDWRSPAWVDYDNNGSLDLLVTSTDGFGLSAENELFQNNGDGMFVKMTKEDVGDIHSLAPGGSEGAVWADYDNDGFLDLFVARYGPDWLFHNNGGGKYMKMTNSLPPDSLDSYSAAWGDYNNDRLPDLFVAVKSDRPTNRLYLNVGGGMFARVISGNIATDSAHSFGGAWADYNNDGFLDLFVNNGGYVGSEANFLYQNNRDGTFTKMTSNSVGSIVGDAGAFNSCAWGDYDNDGFIDLFVTTYACCSNPTPNYLYHNNGDGTFTRVRTGSLVNDRGFSDGCGWGDYDNDGFLDLFVARGINTAATSLLYRNNGNANAWIKAKLVGTLSNRSAIGAKIRLRATIRGQSMWQMREINTGNGLSGSSPLAHFGLGDATNVDLLRIEWPSGAVQELHDIAVRQFLTIVEPARLSAPRRLPDGSFQMHLTSWAGFSFDIETSSNLSTWTPWLTVTTTNRFTRIDDPGAKFEPRRFYRTVHP